MSRWQITKVVLTSEFCFGKHRGKTIKWIIDNDLDYITWCLKEQNNRRPVIRWCHVREEEAKEAREYYEKKLKERMPTTTC